MATKTDSEQILDNIFEIIQRLYDKMRLNKDGENNHLQIFEISRGLSGVLWRKIASS